MNEWHNVYITDKTGEKFWNSNCSPYALMSEIKNLSRYLNNIDEGKTGYHFVDADSAVLIVDGVVYASLVSSEENTMSDDDLLAELLG